MPRRTPGSSPSSGKGHRSSRPKTKTKSPHSGNAPSDSTVATAEPEENKNMNADAQVEEYGGGHDRDDVAANPMADALPFEVAHDARGGR